MDPVNPDDDDEIVRTGFMTVVKFSTSSGLTGIIAIFASFEDQKSSLTLKVRSLSLFFSTGRLSFATASKLSLLSYKPIDVT